MLNSGSLGGYREGTRANMVQQNRRSNTLGREYDARHNRPRSSRAEGSSYTTGRMGSSRSSNPEKEEKFLKQVQEELESRRGEWKDEVDRMIEGLRIQDTVNKTFGDTLKKNGMSQQLGQPGGSNSFVDTSSGSPVFKAFVDVSEYPPQGIHVTCDKLDNKVVVTAKRRPTPDKISQSFTQKVQLPRFADDANIRTKLNREGILMVEVPLLFYFEPEEKKAKSFINQVKSNPDGSKYVEILVNIGAGIRPWELKVGVNDRDELIIHSEQEMKTKSGEIKKKKTLIKRYILPKNTDTRGITSKLGDDGRLSVIVPLGPVMW